MPDDITPDMISELNKKLSYGRIRRSSKAGKRPSPEKLDFGQLAINFADGKLFYKDVNGEVQEFDSKSAPSAQIVDVATGTQTYRIPLVIPVRSEDGRQTSPIYASAEVTYDADAQMITMGKLELDYLKIGHMVIDGVNNVVDFGAAETIHLGNATVTRGEEEETVVVL